MIYFDLDDENEKRKYGEAWRQLGFEEGFEQGQIKGFEQCKKTSKELMTAYFINQGYSQEDAQKTVNAVFDGL